MVLTPTSLRYRKVYLKYIYFGIFIVWKKPYRKPLGITFGFKPLDFFVTCGIKDRYRLKYLNGVFQSCKKSCHRNTFGNFQLSAYHQFLKIILQQINHRMQQKNIRSIINN